MSLIAPYGSGVSADTQRGPSAGLWGDCPDGLKPWLGLVDPSAGYADGDDFMAFGLPGTQTSEINLGKYKVYNTGAGTVKTNSMPNGTATAQLGGIISMLCDTAGDQSVIGTHSCPFSLNASAGKMWFEARIASTGVATNRSQIFVGLGNNVDVTFGAAIPLADADATGTAVALAGWTALEDGTTVLNTSYTDEAAVWTHVQTSAGVLAADTWIKLGMLYVPGATSDALRFYVNGVRTTTSVTAAALAALTHLDASGLGFCFAQFADSSGTSNYAYCDWWYAAQVSV